MVPAGLRLRTPSHAYAQIWLGANDVQIQRFKDGIGERLVDPRPFEGLDEETWLELAGLLADTHYDVVLSPPDVFATTLALPKAAQSRLSTAISLQMNEIAPIEPSLLRWANTRPILDGDKLLVRVAMAKQARLEAVSSLFASHDLDEPAIFGANNGTLVKLLPGGRSRRTLSSNARLFLGAVSLVLSVPLVIWIAAAVLTSKNQQSAAALAQRLAPRIAIEAQAREAERARSAATALLAPPTFSALVEDLAQRLPPTAYVVALEKGADGAVSLTVDTSAPADTRSALQGTTAWRWRERLQETTADGRSQLHYVTSAR
jgi:hypothetical protein